MFLWRDKKEWNEGMELLSPFLFSSKNNFICWNLISSSWPKAVTYLLKEKKNHHEAYLQGFFPQDCQFNQNIYKRAVPLLKEVLWQLWNRSREHESNSNNQKCYLLATYLPLWGGWFESLLPVFYLECYQAYNHVILMISKILYSSYEETILWQGRNSCYIAW